MSNIETQRIPIVMHPKAFSAFGADLVTSDVVALIELVKNAYDAFAYHVEVIFDTDSFGNRTLTVADDGLGMSKDTIVNAWAVIATNHKVRNPFIERDGKMRAVSGNKGMGRFSAARLGTKLSIITKTKEEGCYKIELDWEEFNSARSIEECSFVLDKIDGNVIPQESGTRLLISNLSHIWAEDELADLEEELSRIINPFKQKDEFSILLKYDGIENPIEIAVPDFVNNPKYLFTAHVDLNGNLIWDYSFSPLKKGLGFSNTSSGNLTWNEILEDLGEELSKDSQKTFTANERVNRIILKLAFGHAVLELNEGAAAWKNYMTVIKHEINYRFEMSNKDYTSFYYPIFMKGKIFPEIGSRAFQNLYVIEPLFVDSVDSSQSNISINQVVMDWMCIQEGNYEYLTWIESDGIHVKIAIHDFIFAHIILDFYV